MKKSQIFILSCLSILFCAMFWGGYILYKMHFGVHSMIMKVTDLHNKVNELEALRCQGVGKTVAVDIDVDQITSAERWGKLQKKLQNTVVQLFVQKAEFNWLQPYKVPRPAASLGSGFFISDKGEIVSNAHVVNQSSIIHIQIPSFGKHQFEVDLVGIMPEKDFALLKLKEKDLQLIKSQLGKIPYLDLGDSDLVHRADEVMAIGFPLGQQGLKSTTGVISGREGGAIQMSAPINPGSSGGPAVNSQGQVVGINFSGITAAQNVGYIIPINDLKVFLKELRVGTLIRKPYLGILQSPATPDLVQCLGNPEPGGVYVVDVQSDSPLKGQLEAGDMIYAINGIAVDLYGEMSVPWSEDKISTAEYVARLVPGQKVTFVVYRNGTRKAFTCSFIRKKLAPIRMKYPSYEEINYENFGGFAVMELALNHIPILLEKAPGLTKFTEDKNQNEGALIITNIMPNSPAQRCRLPIMGSVIYKVNNKKVKTLQALQDAIAETKDILKLETTDHVVVAISKKDLIENEPRLATAYAYPVSEGMKRLMKVSTSK